jgi:3',5'-cyclic AMP phosphodiesterase CpdA
LLSFSYQSVSEKKEVRIGFFSDIHFERPAKQGTEFGGVEVDGTVKADFEIPVLVKSTIDEVAPDVIFDSGDMTAHGETGEYKAYRDWRDALKTTVFPVMGNHDRQHNSPHLPYGTGFYSALGYGSATRVLKLGNLVFILISEDHHYEFSSLDAAISSQKFHWIENQLDRFSKGDNNIFIVEHYPIKETVAWSDSYYGLGGFYMFGSPGWFDWWWAPWKRTSEEWKELLEKYEDSVVAHISGHIHLPYGWKDVPNDRELYGYGDGDWKVENIGQFVSGKEITESSRDRPPHKLPDVYFLNIRALNYNHQAASDHEPSASVYYADFTQGKKSVSLRAVDIVTGEPEGSYRVETDYAIDLGDGKIRFVNSDLGIRAKDEEAEITEDAWFKVNRGESALVTFQKEWAEKVTVSDVSIASEGGRYGKIYYKASRDGGKTWSNWSTRRPEEANVLQIRTYFHADEESDMMVDDVRIETR